MSKSIQAKHERRQNQVAKLANQARRMSRTGRVSSPSNLTSPQDSHLSTESAPKPAEASVLSAKVCGMVQPALGDGRGVSRPLF